MEIPDKNRNRFLNVIMCERDSMCRLFFCDSNANIESITNKFKQVDFNLIC